MKLNHVITQRNTSHVIQQFGQAQLVRHSNGSHELIGGSNNDRATAFEWTSLFAHEIVFSHFGRKSISNCRRRKPRLLSRLLPAL